MGAECLYCVCRGGHADLAVAELQHQDLLVRMLAEGLLQAALEEYDAALHAEREEKVGPPNTERVVGRERAQVELGRRLLLLRLQGGRVELVRRGRALRGLQGGRVERLVRRGRALHVWCVGALRMDVGKEREPGAGL